MEGHGLDQEPLPILQRLAAGLVAELKRYLGRHGAEVRQMIAAGGSECGEIASARLAKVYDGLIGSMFHAVRAAMLREGTWQPASVAAVGSWGRGAVNYRSDLDVRLLCPAHTPAAGAAIEALLYPLWDAGLSIGHQVVTLEEVTELARTDLPTATSLLDWRTVAADPAFDVDLLHRVYDRVFGVGVIGDFIQRLATRAENRVERYGGSVYLLEPDVKNGPGGLRDLDVAHWAARARWKVKGLKDLVRVGVLEPRELRQIVHASDLLWRVRNLLHHVAGRRSDRLSFDRQEQLAVSLGYGEGPRGVEEFMSEYYRHARAITRARDLILGRATPGPTRALRSVSIGSGLRITQGAMSLDDPAMLDREPALALRLYGEALRRDLPVFPFARDAVARAALSGTFAERLRVSPEAVRLFVRLVTTTAPARVKHRSLLHELHDVGLLLAMVPEFAPVVGRVHHDIYHVYTVDAHSVAAVERLGRLCRGELAAEFPLASRLAAEISRPQVLFFAVLLHDVGKDIGGRQHARRGAELAEDILARLGFTPEDAVEVQHLIAEHLTMYHVATRRDLDDPATIAEFSRHVRGSEGLRELYLLTICDVSTTSPEAMTSWKARMLEDLYVATDRTISQGAESRNRERTERIREQVRARWRDTETEFLEHFLAAMPERYLYANLASAIVEHARLAAETIADKCRARLLGSEDPYFEVAFVAEDRPGLLALITATLAAARLAVVGAQIHSWRCRDGKVRALDIFWVRASTEADIDTTVRRLERDLGRLLAGELTPIDLGAGLKTSASGGSRPAPEVKIEINVDNRAATAHTVVEVATRDRMGLLFRLATAIQAEGLTISLAKINTEGDRVADVFYVQDTAHAKLTDSARVQSLTSRIRTTIEELENGRIT
ncbi:MAG: [protein-PII] uridylyltransferase [Polyangiaceae bacterium]|nr:[protein-PII] uridylyltransferase [Polyangiaceae bacterium]